MSEALLLKSRTRRECPVKWPLFKLAI
jgi:hypothetical protein